MKLSEVINNNVTKVLMKTLDQWLYWNHTIHDMHFVKHVTNVQSTIITTYLSIGVSYLSEIHKEALLFDHISCIIIYLFIYSLYFQLLIKKWWNPYIKFVIKLTHNHHITNINNKDIKTIIVSYKPIYLYMKYQGERSYYNECKS